MKRIALLLLLAGCASHGEAPAPCSVSTDSTPCDAEMTFADGSKLPCEVCMDSTTKAPVDECTLKWDVFEQPTASYTVLCVASCDECQP